MLKLDLFKCIHPPLVDLMRNQLNAMLITYMVLVPQLRDNLLDNTKSNNQVWMAYSYFHQIQQLE